MRKYFETRHVSLFAFAHLADRLPHKGGESSRAPSGAVPPPGPLGYASRRPKSAPTQR